MFTEFKNRALYADDTDVQLTYRISFKRTPLGEFNPHTGEYIDYKNNDCDFENLEQCLEGIYKIYEYDKDYYFGSWFDHIKIKVVSC